MRGIVDLGTVEEVLAQKPRPFARWLTAGVLDLRELIGKRFRFRSIGNNCGALLVRGQTPLICDREPGHTGDHHNADTGYQFED